MRAVLESTVLGLVQAIGDMGSTVVAGLLWSLLSPAIAFGYVAAWMLLSVSTSTMLRSRRTQPEKRNDCRSAQ